MSKQFQIKVYDINWNFKKTVNPNILRSQIQFNHGLNQGQGNLNFVLNLPYDDTSIQEMDVFQVKLKNKDFPNWKIIYTGFVQDILRTYDQNNNYITFFCVWMASLMKKVFFRSGTNTKFTATGTASNIITSVVNYFNTVYTWNWFNTSWIESTTGQIQIRVDSTDCLQTITEAVNTTEKYLRIWADWTVYFKTKASNPTHFITAQKHLQSLTIKEEWTERANRVVLNWQTLREVEIDWQTEIIAQPQQTTVEDASLIATNQLTERSFENLNINDSSTATAYANRLLDELKKWKKQITLTINSEYIIENIKVGDTVKVLNLEYPINNLQIVNISYNTNQVVLTLEKFDTLSKILQFKR